MIHPNCDHVCSGNCRRENCNKYEDDRQRIHIEVIFNTRQNPGSLLHLREIAKAYLAPKGIALLDDLSIEV